VQTGLGSKLEPTIKQQQQQKQQKQQQPFMTITQPALLKTLSSFGDLARSLGIPGAA
jgi:hypothetical protein